MSKSKYRIVKSKTGNLYHAETWMTFWFMWDPIAGTYADTPEESERLLRKILAGPEVVKEMKL